MFFINSKTKRQHYFFEWHEWYTKKYQNQFYRGVFMLVEVTSTNLYQP